MYKFVTRDGNSSVYSALSEVLQDSGHWERVECKQTDNFNLLLADRNNISFERLGSDGRRQLVNYYRGSKALCRKALLARTLRTHSVLHCNDPFHWFPQTFVIYPKPTEADTITESTQKSDKPSIRQLKAAAIRLKDERQLFLQAKAEAGDGSIWIVKCTTGAQGAGILISKNPEDILSYIDAQELSHVVQRYIESPMLLPGSRKFDIRSWVLLDDQYRVHLFREGVLRTASEPYQLCDLTYVTSHITNHCLQEAQSPNYGKYETGNEMFFDEFERILQTTGDVLFKRDIMPQIKDIIVQCIHIIKEEVCTDGLPYRSFQLFGFDFLLDSNFKIWLLEVNGAPACASALLPSLTSSIKQTAIDPVFPPPELDTTTESLFECLE